jgi:AcrR family transcriptional regulator
MEMRVPMTRHATLSRERIVATTMKLATAQGFAATSLRQIADPLGVTVAGLYYYYETKDDLLGDVLRAYLDRIDGIVDASTRDREPALFVLREVLELCLGVPDLVRLATCDPAVVGHPVYGPELAKRHEQLRTAVMGERTGRRAETLACAALTLVSRPLLEHVDVPAALARAELVPAAMRVLAA